MIADLAFFSNANKINKHVNIKGFVIATFTSGALSDRSAGVPIFLTMTVCACQQSSFIGFFSCITDYQSIDCIIFTRVTKVTVVWASLVKNLFTINIQVNISEPDL